MLVDGAGRMVFTPRLHDDKTQAVLEARIEELPNRPSADARSAARYLAASTRSVTLDGRAVER